MNNARRENGGHFHLYFAEKASPLGEKLSAKRTDVGRVCPDSPLPGGSGKVCPHPSAGGAADTSPRGGKASILYLLLHQQLFQRQQRGRLCAEGAHTELEVLRHGAHRRYRDAADVDRYTAGRSLLHHTLDQP